MPQLTIDFTPAQTQRIKDAFTSKMELELFDANGDPRPATADDVKTYLMRELRKVVQTHERNEAQKAHVDASVPLDLT